MAPPVSDPPPEEAGDLEEGGSRRRESSGQCRWCGQPLPLLARLRGARFCSEWHERQYRRQQSEQFLERVKKYRRVGGGSRLRSESAKVIIRPSPSGRGKREPQPASEGATRSALPEIWRDPPLLLAAVPSVAAPLACEGPASRPALTSVSAPERTAGCWEEPEGAWVQEETSAPISPSCGAMAVQASLGRNGFMPSFPGEIPGLTPIGQVSGSPSGWVSSVLWVPPRLPGLSGNDSGPVTTASWRTLPTAVSQHPARVAYVAPGEAKGQTWSGPASGEVIRSPLASQRQWASRPLLTLFVHLLPPMRGRSGLQASDPVRRACGWQGRAVSMEGADAGPSWATLVSETPSASCATAFRHTGVAVAPACVRPTVAGSAQLPAQQWMHGFVSRSSPGSMMGPGKEPVLPGHRMSGNGRPAGTTESEWLRQGKILRNLRHASPFTVARLAAQASVAYLAVQAGEWTWTSNPWRIRLALSRIQVMAGGTMCWDMHVLLPCSVQRAGAAAGSAEPETQPRQEGVWRIRLPGEPTGQLTQPEDATLGKWWKRQQEQEPRLPRRGGLKMPVFHGHCETVGGLARPETAYRWIPDQPLPAEGSLFAFELDQCRRIPRLLPLAGHRLKLAGWTVGAWHDVWALEPAPAVAVGAVPEFGSLHGVVWEHLPLSPRIPPRQSDGSVPVRPQRLRLPGLHCRFPEAAHAETGQGRHPDEARPFRAGLEEMREHR